jgi:DnaJ-class molecular chaperone
MNARTTKKHPDECNACNGFGQVAEFRTIVEQIDERFVTTQIGSACLKCGGTGRLAPGESVRAASSVA